MRIIEGDDDSYDEINKPNGFRGGVKIWRNDAGQIHRDGGLPAVIWETGETWYYKNGERLVQSWYEKNPEQLVKFNW